MMALQATTTVSTSASRDDRGSAVRRCEGRLWETRASDRTRQRAAGREFPPNLPIEIASGIFLAHLLPHRWIYFLPL